jgi:protocatechuate 3,4-dioxygenase beta subunit
MPAPTKPQPLYRRRDALRIGAAAAVGMYSLGAARTVLAACAQSPSQTEGPYWVDEMLNRADVRTDPSTGVPQPGLPVRLLINVSEMTAGACAPLAGAYVDIWHCNAQGVYSDVSAEGTVGQRYLRGYQATDEHGNVRFLTIYPGWYPGRTVHVHFRVRRFSGATATFNFVSQLYFDDEVTTAIFRRVSPYAARPDRDTTNARDMIYAMGGSQLLLRMSDNGDHVVASFNVVVNSAPGIVGRGISPADAEAAEHACDFGGGTPPVVLS